MILAYVTMGIADLSQGAGKLLLITVAIAYGSTLIAGTASFLVAGNLFPNSFPLMVDRQSPRTKASATADRVSNTGSSEIEK